MAIPPRCAEVFDHFWQCRAGGKLTGHFGWWFPRWAQRVRIIRRSQLMGISLERGFLSETASTCNRWPPVQSSVLSWWLVICDYGLPCIVERRTERDSLTPTIINHHQPFTPGVVSNLGTPKPQWLIIIFPIKMAKIHMLGTYGWRIFHIWFPR